MRARWLLWPAMAAFAVGFAALSIGRQRAFSTGRFDLGNMTQAVWATAHGHFLEVTNLAGRADLSTRLALRPDPRRPSRRSGSPGRARTCCSSSRRSRSRSARCPSTGSRASTWGPQHAAARLRVRLPALPGRPSGSSLNEFHPVAFACPLLLYAFWYLDEDRLVPFALFALARDRVQGGDRARRRRLRALVRRHAPAVDGGGRDPGRGPRRLGDRGRGRRAALQRQRVRVLLALQRGRRHARRNPEDAVHAPAARARKRVLARPTSTTSRHLLVPLGFLFVLSPVLLLAALPGGRAQRAVEEPLPGVALLPLHGRADRAALRRERARRRCARRGGGRARGRAIGAGSRRPRRRCRTTGSARSRSGRRSRAATTSSATRRTSRRTTGSRRVRSRLVPERRGRQRHQHARQRTSRRGGGSSASRASTTRPGSLSTRRTAATSTAARPLPMEGDVAALRRDPGWRLVFEQDGVLVFRRVSAVRPAARRTEASGRASVVGGGGGGSR